MFATEVRDFRVSPGAVIVEEGIFNEDDPHCCPSGRAIEPFPVTIRCDA